jgi:hypothetical protein
LRGISLSLVGAASAGRQFAAPVTLPQTTRKEANPMRLAAYLLAVILIIVAVIYFLMPADSLPTFFPGHEPGLTRIRMKHGIAAGAAGVILLLVGWFVGRSKA